MVFAGSTRLRSLWTPERINTAVWLDASDASTVVTVASKVGEWYDKSGNDRKCTQLTDELRPTYVTNSFNGKNIVRFPGGKYYYLDFVTSLPLQNTATIFAVCENEVQDGTASIWKPIIATTSSDFTNSPTGYALAKRRSDISGFGGKPPSNGGLTSFVISYPANANTFEILGLTCNENVIQARRNGQSVFDSSDLVPRTSGWATNYRVGAEFNNVANRYYTGDLCEVIICNTVPDLSITQKIEGYLAHKWGLEANLPSNHPYKDNPPRGV